jgi:hypothetical protein
MKKQTIAGSHLREHSVKLMNDYCWERWTADKGCAKLMYVLTEYLDPNMTDRQFFELHGKLRRVVQEIEKQIKAKENGK